MAYSHILAAFLAVLSIPALTQELMPIKDVTTRKPPSFAPLHEGRAIVVRGVVAGSPIRLRTYSHLILQDPQGAGVTVESGREALAQYASGDRLEVAGVVGERAGLPVLRSQRIKKLGSGPPVPPQTFEIADIVKLWNLGRYVTTEGNVLGSGSNSGGDLVVVGNAGISLTVFLPREQRSHANTLRGFRPGDRVRVTGFSSQYCPIQPFDRDFQIMIGSPSALTLVSRGWFISPNVLISCLLGAAFAGTIWWRRERRMAERRSVLQAVMRLSEDVISAPSPREIIRRLQRDLPRAIGAGEVEVFLYNRPTNTLDAMAPDSNPKAPSISMDEPIGSFYSTVALCFRNRALLHVPDTRRSPLLTDRDKLVPASALFVPMYAQREVVGVLAAYFRKPVRRASPDRHAALQHLGNQVAASLKLQEQHHMREQLFRSEKMAAAGQLISGVANDLRAPLENISRAARQVLLHSSNGHPELHRIASDAERGLEVVSHLVSFARMERSEARPLDFFALIDTLLELRKPDRERKGVKAEATLPISPLEVMADQAQLEQALLTMLVHAEHAAAHSSDHSMIITTRVVGRKAQLAIDCALGNGPDPFSGFAKGDYFGLPVAQAIAQSHGGDLRHLPGRLGFRLEFEMPVYTQPAPPDKPAASQQKPLRVLTALIVEPDTVSQRKLLAMLAARGHRAIPATTAEDAADLVQRLAFDVVFCAVRLPGLNWVELFQRVHRRIGAFALVTDGYDAESARAFKSGEGQILPKPIEDSALDTFLALVEVRYAASRR